MPTESNTTEINTSKAIAQLDKVCKTYQLGRNELKVLREVSISFPAGEYVAIMGPSGSGKSTLLNLLGCLDRPSSGRYLIGEQDVSRMTDDELSEVRGRYIGFIFQSYNLIAQLNVIENIAVPMFYQGQYDTATDRATELAVRVGLGDRLHHRPSELSGGQQQRVAIARALVNDPLVILADEPTGNLDSKSGREILVLLDQLHEQGKTLIMVTHDRKVAQRSQKTIHLLDGEIERIEHNHTETH